MALGRVPPSPMGSAWGLLEWVGSRLRPGGFCTEHDFFQFFFVSSLVGTFSPTGEEVEWLGL